MTTTDTTATSGTAAPEPLGWWSRRFGGLPPAFWTLMSGVGLARLGFFAVPFLSFWLVADRQFGPVQTAWIMTAFGAGWTISMPLGGWLADRAGRRAVIAAGAVASAGAYLLLGGVRGLTATAAAAALTGITFDLYRPAVQASIADTIPADSRSRALALLYLVMNVSRCIACVLGGLLAEHAFVWLFMINAAVNLIFGALALRALPGRTRIRSSGAARPLLRTALTDRTLLAFTAITAVFYTIHMQSMISLPVVLDRAGATPLQYGLLLALDPLVVVVVQLAAQHWLTRTPAMVVCALGVLTVGVGLALTGMSTSLTWAATTIPIWVIGEVMFLTASPGVVAAIAPEQLRGVYFGVWGGTQGAAAIAAPLLTSLLRGSDLIWFLGAAAGAVAAAACLAMRAAARAIGVTSNGRIT